MTGFWHAPRWESPAYLRLADGQSCVLCGCCDGSVVSAHLPHASYAPAGTGGKCNDLITGHLCGECHDYIDNGGRHDFERRLRALGRTLVRNTAILDRLEVK